MDLNDDNKIKDLFGSFDPKLSSSFDFIKKLERNMDAVEIVKRHNLAMRRRSRKAVLIAALSGFVAGVVLSILLPLAGRWIGTLSVSLPLPDFGSLSFGTSFISWAIIAVVSTITALNAYEIAMAKLSEAKSR
ncbi:MAG: hypothetical protein NC418_07300 [Muribaculaceae bacterium]|nr:hypothetical protein [Muribaculaceae bacterium]